jgi:RNA polymerase sigma factor (sigma-70 family)
MQETSQRRVPARRRKLSLECKLGAYALATGAILATTDQAAAVSAGEDLDVELLKNTQTYLECRFRRQAPSGVSIEAWEQFYRICDPLLQRYARVFHVPETDLTDFLQEVWTELIKTLRSFHYDRARGRFSSWLYRVVRSKAIDLLRRRTRRPPLNLSSAYQEAIESREDDPATACERNNQQEQVRHVLTQLCHQVSPSNYRLFHLRWIEGRSMEEIATALHLAPNQVRFRHHRTKRKFQLMYHQCCLRTQGSASAGAARAERTAPAGVPMQLSLALPALDGGLAGDFRHTVWWMIIDERRSG